MEWVVTPRCSRFNPRNNTVVPGPISTVGENLASAVIQTRTVQPVGSSYNDYCILTISVWGIEFIFIFSLEIQGENISSDVSKIKYVLADHTPNVDNTGNINSI